MKRLTTAPNLALATLWSDMLVQAGIARRVVVLGASRSSTATCTYWRVGWGADRR